MSVPAEVEKLGVFATANTWAFTEMAGKGVADGDASQLSSVINKAAPDFELETIEGEKFKLSDNVGKDVLVLDFWATWCGPCLKAMPDIKAAVGEFDQGVRLLTINQQETPREVREFLEAREWSMEVLMDSELTVRDQFGVSGIPTTVIIGKDGIVKMVHAGYSPGLKDALISDIKKALE